MPEINYDIKSILESCKVNKENYIVSGDIQFQQIEEKFNLKFADLTVLRVTAQALTWALFSAPLSLCYLGIYTSVYIELYAILERFVLRDIPTLLGKDKESIRIISSLIERKTLPELSEVLFKKKIWTKEDVVFARALTNKRNAIAHKNSELLSKYFGNGDELYIGDAEALVQNSDCTDYIVNSIALLAKLAMSNAPLD